jgi:hypothetical protein
MPKAVNVQAWWKAHAALSWEMCRGKTWREVPVGLRVDEREIRAFLKAEQKAEQERKDGTQSPFAG